MTLDFTAMGTVGVTGPRTGLSTDLQKERLYAKLLRFNLITDGPADFRFGDCVGVDAASAEIAQTHGYRTIAHPPMNPEFRAFFPADVILPPKSYFARNRDIVNRSDVLIACPENAERKRGGTWYTIEYARSLKKPILFIFADGSARWENG